MDFFDSFIEKAKDVCDIATKKTGEVVEVSKIKLECVKLNNEIKHLYENLGSSVYSMIKADFENKTVIDSLTEDIDEALLRLSVLNDKLSDIKNVIVCDACGAKNPTTNYYCSKCGSRIQDEFAGYDDLDDDAEPEPEPTVDAFDELDEKDETGF